MKKLIILLVFLFMMGMLNSAKGSVYHNAKTKIIGCGNTTKDWTIRHVSIAKDWTIKYTYVAKDGVVNYVTSEEFSDMIYLVGDGLTLGFVFNEERCEDIIERHPISGRIVSITSRVVVVVIISKVATTIVYYVIRRFAAGGVYVSYKDGVVNYVGRTNNFIRRATEWALKGRVISPVFRSPFLKEQRIYEQLLIDQYGIKTLINKIHSIAPH